MSSAPWHVVSAEDCARQLAATEGSRNPAWRVHLLINAAQAHAEAAQRIQDAESQGWDMREPRRQLQERRGALTILRGEQQKAA